MAEEFNPGDVVVLKSGSPVMTVESMNKETAQVDCIWFEKMKQHRGSFLAATLKKYERPQGGAISVLRG